MAVRILLLSDWEEEVEWRERMLGAFGQDPLFLATSLHTGVHVCSSPNQRQHYPTGRNQLQVLGEGRGFLERNQPQPCPPPRWKGRWPLEIQ